MPGPKSKSPEVATLKHQDKRKNIPTNELRDFMAEDEKSPASMLYPRDPSLDPQLVWQGKDQQDRQDLSVPVVPVYIQEKIHPQAIIEDLRRQAKAQGPGQLDFFSDFNGISFEEQIEFYQHESKWSNRMILGDSLLVLTSLAEKEGLKGQVQMIYLDPPYGIKFGSNWQVSTRKTDIKDGKAEDTTRQPEQIRAFRDTWSLGIHSYLSYLRDRLVIARELLSDSGSLFIQINDENVHLIRNVTEEIFGSENFVVTIIIKKKSVTTITNPINDYLLWFTKDKSKLKPTKLIVSKSPFDEKSRFKLVEFADGTRKSWIACSEKELREPGLRFLNDDYPLVSQDESDTRSGPFKFNGNALHPGRGRHWTYDPDEGMERLSRSGRIRAATNTARGIIYFDDYGKEPISNIWDFHGERDPIYVVQTNKGIIERCLLMATNPGDLVLDPTCGSGTTAYVAEQWGRRWITMDTSRVALALARTRLMSAKYTYYLLADSKEGRELEAELAGLPHTLEGTTPAGDVRKGFVHKRVPYITLKSIAYNEHIDTIHHKWQARLEPVLNKLNAALKKKWREWEPPREPGDKWPAQAKDLLAQWWTLRRERQAEIDQCIAQHADQETLYDQPYPDNKRIRVAGPFTVESLSPHRVLPAEEDAPAAGQQAQADSPRSQFVTTILDNLRKAGVQNTVKNERLKFERLEPYAGVWLSGQGEYAEKDGSPRRVAVAIGPEHGTVGPELIKEAAKEAVMGVGFNLLVVCGFAFDPHVSEETKRYGNLTVLITRMNPDLAMGDELLKKTGAGNLFMVFGEPDIEVNPQDSGKLTVTIKGVDVYDPTTGQIRSNSTDDIACWFIDTNYNGESFFVRHAYFTGNERPYEKLQRALRAEVDEAAWEALYLTTSRPFDPPATGKIAVKVINHYGDEVLKVVGV